MAFLQSLIDRFLNRKNREEQPSADHYEMLERLRKNHDWIDVHVATLDKSFQSLILAIDVDNHELLIDELFPAEDLDTIKPGDTVSITSRSRRILVNFFTRILAREQQDGNTVYRLELPEEIGRNHNRGAYRIYVGGEENLRFSMGLEREELLAPRIINLSADGIKVSFEEDISSQLKTQSFYGNCIIHLPSAIDVDCEFEVRNVYQMHTPHLHSLAGGTIRIPNPQQRAKLNQYLASVQRKQRRRELRIV